MDTSNTNATSSTSAASPSSPSDNKKTTDTKKAMVTVHMHTPDEKVETFSVRRSDTAASLLSLPILSAKSGIDPQHLKVNYGDVPFPVEGPEKTLEANRAGPNAHLYCYDRAEEEKVANGRTRYVRDAKEQGEERRKLFGSTGKAQ